MVDDRLDQKLFILGPNCWQMCPRIIARAVPMVLRTA